MIFKNEKMVLIVGKGILRDVDSEILGNVSTFLEHSSPDKYVCWISLPENVVN